MASWSTGPGVNQGFIKQGRCQWLNIGLSMVCLLSNTIWLVTFCHPPEHNLANQIGRISQGYFDYSVPRSPVSRLVLPRRSMSCVSQAEIRPKPRPRMRIGIQDWFGNQSSRFTRGCALVRCTRSEQASWPPSAHLCFAGLRLTLKAPGRSPARQGPSAPHTRCQLT